MTRRLLLPLLVLVALATPAAAQVTIPYSFTFETTIDQDQVNSNFTTLGNAALNRTGGTATGAITSAGGSITGSWAGSPTFTANPTFTGTPVFSNAVTMSGTTTYSGTLTSSGGTISGSWAGNPTFSGNPSFTGTPTFSNAEAIKFTQTGLTIASSTAANALTLKPNEALTAGRTFNIVTGDADRTVTLSGSPTLNDWFNQNVKTTATPTFAGLTVPGVPVLLYANTGTNSAAGATTVDSIAISGLTAKDTLLVVATLESVTQQTATPSLYHVTDAGTLTNLLAGALAAGTRRTEMAMVRQAQQGATSLGAAVWGAETTFGNFGATTNWTGSWTLGLRHGGVTAGGTFQYSWAVYKISGQ